MKRLLTTLCILLCAASLSAQNIDIKGKVLDTNQQVLEGASIAVRLPFTSRIRCW